MHPETNEPVVYVNPSFTREIVDLSPRESRHVLDLLFEEIGRPEYTVRFKWEPGSVAFWDNRAALHLAPRTSNTSTVTGYCTASRWSATFRSAPTVATPSRSRGRVLRGA